MKEIIKLKEMPIGFIRENIFYTYRRPQHFMRKYGGFGISAEIIKILIEETAVRNLWLFLLKN